MNITLRELVDGHAGGVREGRTLKAVIPGGSSVPILLPDQLDIPASFDGVQKAGSLLGSAGIIVLDAILARTTKHMRVPPLAVGLGIYLPTASTLMIVVGTIVGYIFDRRADRTPKPESTKQLGVLLASGLIVGESIIGVVLSAIVVFSGIAAPFSLGSAEGPWFWKPAGIIIGGLAFAGIGFLLYRWILRMGAARSA